MACYHKIILFLGSRFLSPAHQLHSWKGELSKEPAMGSSQIQPLRQRPLMATNTVALGAGCL